jgi:hypothetical protein
MSAPIDSSKVQPENTQSASTSSYSRNTPADASISNPRESLRNRRRRVEVESVADDSQSHVPAGLTASEILLHDTPSSTMTTVHHPSTASASSGVPNSSDVPTTTSSILKRPILNSIKVKEKPLKNPTSTAQNNGFTGGDFDCNIW